MNHKTFIAATLAATALMGLGTAAQATPAVVAGSAYGPSVYVQPAPPAPMYEAVIPPLYARLRDGSVFESQRVRSPRPPAAGAATPLSM